LFEALHRLTAAGRHSLQPCAIALSLIAFCKFKRPSQALDALRGVALPALQAVHKITLKALAAMDAGSKAYVAIGRMFMQVRFLASSRI
jgi:hypothetical protein